MRTWIANLSLRWKLLFAPAFLILVLVGVGVYEAYVQRQNQESVAALMSGPVRQAETVADFAGAAWMSQVHLYRLMATAANETDQKKVKALEALASRSLAEMAEKLKALQDPALEKGKTGEKLNRAAARRSGFGLDLLWLG